MWATAHQVWSDWDYGKREGDSAINVCPCRLRLSRGHVLRINASDERSAEESKLHEAIETVEHEWFNSVTELMTERE